MKGTHSTTHLTLQGLPAELRLNIYHCMSPPIDSRIADWQGIYTSCKQFHYEMKHVLLRNMVRYLEHIKVDWMKIHNAPLQISIPTSIVEIEDISITIPNSYFRARESHFPAARRLSAALVYLFQLGISRLTIGRYEDDRKIKHRSGLMTEHTIADFMRDLLDLMETSKPPRVVNLDDGAEHILLQGTTIDKIVFDWGKVDTTSGDEDLILPYYAEEHPFDRTMELKRDHLCGPTTGAVWTRREYTWYGLVLEDFWSEAQPVPKK